MNGDDGDPTVPINGRLLHQLKDHHFVVKLVLNGTDIEFLQDILKGGLCSYHFRFLLLRKGVAALKERPESFAPLFDVLGLRRLARDRGFYST